MSREHKECMVKELAECISRSPGIFVSGFSQIGAEDMNTLRRKLDDCSARFLVVKNRIIKLALIKAEQKDLTGLVNETTALTLVEEGPEKVARILVDFAKDHVGLVTRGAVFEGETLQHEDIEELATLPSKDVLLGQFARTLAAPVRRFLNIGVDSLTKFIRILGSLKK